MTVFLMHLIIFIMVELRNTWFGLKQSFVEEVILQQDLSISMRHLANTQRFCEQLSLCQTDKWQTERYIFMRNYGLFSIGLGEIPPNLRMLTRFLQVSTESLITVFRKHGFFSNIGQSLEMTRIALYIIPLILSSHFIINRTIIYYLIFHCNAALLKPQKLMQIILLIYLSQYLYTPHFLMPAINLCSNLQMEKLLFANTCLNLCSLFQLLFLYSTHKHMNRVSPLPYQEEDRSIHTLQRREEAKNQIEVIDQFMGLRICRICLEEEEQFQPETMDQAELMDRQLIIPCECRGSVGFVHQKCIKMWIQKQIDGSKTNRSFCQICKSQIFFKKTKVRYCECSVHNLCETSPCNIACLIAEIVLIGILALVQNYIDHNMNFPLLKNTLLALLGILCLTFALTLLLIVKDIFIRTTKEIDRIYSLTESQLLRLREPKTRTMTSIIEGKKRKIQIMKKEIQRPLHPFGSISPELMIIVN